MRGLGQVVEALELRAVDRAAVLPTRSEPAAIGAAAAPAAAKRSSTTSVSTRRSLSARSTSSSPLAPLSPSRSRAPASRPSLELLDQRARGLQHLVGARARRRPRCAPASLLAEVVVELLLEVGGHLARPADDEALEGVGA